MCVLQYSPLSDGTLCTSCVCVRNVLWDGEAESVKSVTSTRTRHRHTDAVHDTLPGEGGRVWIGAEPGMCLKWPQSCDVTDCTCKNVTNKIKKRKTKRQLKIKKSAVLTRSSESSSEASGGILWTGAQRLRVHTHATHTRPRACAISMLGQTV